MGEGTKDSNRIVTLNKKIISREKERERFYSHKAGNQKGHAYQTWCLLFINISMI